MILKIAMQDQPTTFRNLIKDEPGRSFSEHMLTNVLHDVLNEISLMHNSNKSHGQISLDTLTYDQQRRRAGLNPPLLFAEANQTSISKDITDLGSVIVAVLTFNSNEELTGLIKDSRWQGYCLVSDQFARVLTRSLSKVPGVRYDSAVEMLRDLASKDNALIPQGLVVTPAQSDQARPLLPLIDSETSSTILVTSRWQSLSGNRSIIAIISAATIILGVSLIVSTIKPNTRIEAPLLLKYPGLSPSQDANYKSEQQIENSPSTSPADNKLYLNGIDLPITNRLCNKRGSFCIYNLAKIILEKSGEAHYSFSEMQRGRLIEIKGTIQIANNNVLGRGKSPSFTFRDDQNYTTPGWAAAGFFDIGQDVSNPGIRTVFKATESFGPKTPVGLENIAFLFPK
jgi:hypothetical protein